VSDLFDYENELRFAEGQSISRRDLPTFAKNLTIQESAIGRTQVFHPICTLHLQNPSVVPGDVMVVGDRYIVCLITANFTYRLI
jgi:hypothetical protein